MLPRKICYTGLHILLTIHIAHSFVLLTANIDDLKKLARKFVSDQFAEKIVELIAKATSGLLTPAPNMSEENEANVEDIQRVSDNEVMDPYKGVQGPKLPLRTTSSRYADVSAEALKPKQIKVNSQYAESDLRSQELTELSEYRNPLKLPKVKPQEYSSVRNNEKPLNFLRQNPQPQNYDGDKGNIKVYNIEQKRPKISYHKSKVPDRNSNIGARYAAVNLGDENRQINNSPIQDDRYYPVSEPADVDRNPKILDLTYQIKKDTQKGYDKAKDYFGKVKAKEDKIKESIRKDNKKRKAKSEEYLDKVKKLAKKDRADKIYNYNNKKEVEKINKKGKLETKEIGKINSDPQIRSNASKNDTLHMFIQKGGQLEEVTPMVVGRKRVEFDQYQPKNKYKYKHTLRSRKSKNKIKHK